MGKISRKNKKKGSVREFSRRIYPESNRRIYLDYAASTPVDPRAIQKMLQFLATDFGNPGSLHTEGQRAIAGLDEARETVAQSLGVDFNEIIFTGSATAANNISIYGALQRYQQIFPNKKARIIVSAIEHESVLETVHALEKKENMKVEVVVIPVNKLGIVDINAIKSSINEDTVLVSIMYVNNEIGTIQPIKSITEIVGGAKNGGVYPLFHTDASQAFQYLSCKPEELGVDLMTLSSQKMYGPKGVGVLYVKKSKNTSLSQHIIEPTVRGGGQEFGLFSGTENVAGIAGFAESLKIANALREKEAQRIGELKIYFWKEIKKIVPSAQVNGVDPLGNKNTQSAPHIVNIHIPKMESQDFLTRLDLAGVAASAGSACASRSTTLSHVLTELGHSVKRIKESVRFSFGRPTTYDDLKKTIQIIKEIVK